MKRLYAILPPLVAVLLSAGYTGCTGSTEPAYDPEAFACVLSVDSVRSGEADCFTLRYEREGDCTQMTVTAPETLEGITFTCAGEAWVMTAEQCPIPLSAAVSADLQEMAELLSSTAEEAKERRDSDGGTVLCFPAGEMTLGPDGLPAMLHTAAGRLVKVIPAADPP